MSQVRFYQQIITQTMFLIKCFTTLGAIFILALGLGLLGITIYLFFNNSIFLGNTNIEYTVLGMSFGLSVTVIGTAAEGIYGICKKKPKVVCVFQIIVIILMLIFFAFGVSLFFLPDIFFNGGCGNSSNLVINYANSIYNISDAIFCKQTCACGLDNTTAAFNSTYNSTQKAYITSYNLSKTGAIDSISCIQGNLTDNQIAILGAVGNLQKFLQCSLWCQNSDPYNLIYRFSDINSGKPLHFCYTRLQDLYTQYSQIGKIVLFGAGGVMALMFLCNLYICCSKEKEGRSRRERFMYYEDQRLQEDRYDRFEARRDKNRDYRRVDERRRY